MKEIVVDIEDLIDLKKDSLIKINIGESSYIFTPISLAAFTAYEKLSKGDDPTDGKAYLLSICSVEPLSIEDAEDLPAGLAAVLVTNLLKASFLMLPTSN